MVPPLDIFAVNGGEPLWLASADTVAHALTFAKNHGEGLYFVFSQQTGRKEFYRIDSAGSVERAHTESAT